MVLLVLAGCLEPPKTNQMEQAVSGLADLHRWDPGTQARGQLAYDAVMGWGPEIWPHLAAHLTDETPTAIHEELYGITPVVGDICFLMLLQLTRRNCEDFSDDGVYLSRQIPNPAFCVRWKDPAPVSRKRVQEHFFRLLPK